MIDRRSYCMKRTTFLAFLFTVLGISFVWAQTNVVGTNTPPAGTGGVPAFTALPQWLQLLITPLTFALVALVKKYLPRISAAWLPLAAAVVGAVVNSLSDLIGLWGTQGLTDSALLGAALGALATWLHQLGKQSGVIPPTPPTPPAS